MKASFETKLLNVKKQIQQIMWQDVGIVRTTAGLSHAVDTLGKLNQQLGSEAVMNEEFLSVRNMAQAALLIAQAALARKKSLGSHCRIN